MEKPKPKIKICLSGSHCSSKTTLSCYVVQKLKTEGIEDVMLREEVARRCPYPINTSGPFLSQFWISMHTILSELELKDKCQILLCDRGMLDQVVYAADGLSHGMLSQAQFTYIKSLATNWIRLEPYTVTFLLSPAPLVADSVRPMDTSWQEAIWLGFKYWTPELLKDSRWQLISVNNLRQKKDYLYSEIKKVIKEVIG